MLEAFCRTSFNAFQLSMETLSVSVVRFVSCGIALTLIRTAGTFATNMLKLPRLSSACFSAYTSIQFDSSVIRRGEEIFAAFAAGNLILALRFGSRPLQC